MLELFEMLILFISVQQHNEIHFLRMSLKTPLASFVHFRNYIFKINLILKRDLDYSIRSQSIAAFQPDLMKVNRPRTNRMSNVLLLKKLFGYLSSRNCLLLMKSISETNHNVSDAMRCFMSVNWILVWKCKKPGKL